MTTMGSRDGDNILLCVICNQQLHRPKMMPCLHTFCEECIREFIFSRAYDSVGRFPCPVCRQVVCIPDGGVASLPDKFNIVGLMDAMSLDRSEVSLPMAFGGTNLRYCFGRRGSAVTDFVQPVGLAVKSCGDIVVSDGHRNRIMTFDLRGHVRGVFSCRHGISDIAVTDSDTVVVAGHGDALAVEYDSVTGARLRSFGTFSRLDPAHGIAVLQTPPFQIAVSLCDTGTLCVLADSGRLVRKFARRSVVGKPYHIASSCRGDVILSDHANNRVCVIDRLTGSCKVQMGFIGTGRGSLYQPLGVAVDEKDNIIVADSGNRRVVLFSSAGKFGGVLIDASRSIGKPINVAYKQGSGVLAVLVTGHDYAQVRIYSYIPTKFRDTSTLDGLACFTSGQTV